MLVNGLLEEVTPLSVSLSLKKEKIMATPTPAISVKSSACSRKLHACILYESPPITHIGAARLHRWQLYDKKQMEQGIQRWKRGKK